MAADGPPAGTGRRDLLWVLAVTTTTGTMPTTSAAARTSPASAGTTDAAGRLTDVRGANYVPTYAFNAYQTWRQYDQDVVERDLGYAADLGLNSLRAWASYYFWREDPAAFFERVEQFLAACEAHDIAPLVVLFEAPGNEPTGTNLTEPEGFATHSPSRRRVIVPRNWAGDDGSPIQFARRWASEYATDDRLLATEVMNEPGNPDGAPKRVDFANDALEAVASEAPGEPTLTMGTKTVDHVRHYDGPEFDGHLDVHQFHYNLPPDEAAMREGLRAASEHRERAGNPVYCTEWQRTLEEPPNRFQPNLESLAPTMRAAHDRYDLDGDYFWQLMLQRAYLEPPRRAGRYNGLFRENGVPFDVADYRAVRGDRRPLPGDWYDDPFDYPEPGEAHLDPDE